MLRLTMIMTMLLMLSACSATKPLSDVYTPATFPVLSAIGYAPIESQPSTSHAEKVMMAMKSSKILAYRELAEQVYGLQLDANTKVQDWLMQTNVTSTKVAGLIKGARVIKAYPADEFYVTELELDFRLVWELYQQADSPREHRALVIEPAQNF